MLTIGKKMLGAGLLALASLHVQAQEQEKSEGSLVRSLFGPSLEQDYGIKVSGLLDIGYVRNNRSTRDERDDGLSNLPLTGYSDEGLELASVHVFVDKPLVANVIPRVTPLPGPSPEQFSFGFSMETLYGRNGQFARTFGWDMHWDANSPGDDDPDSAKRHKQKFVATPNLFASMYMPYGPGVSVIAGIFGPAIGYEIPPNIREARNPFASKTYAFVTEPSTVSGILASTRLFNGESSLLGAELGVVQGWNNLRDNNHGKSVMGALRWRTADMRTWVDYEFMVGDEENQNIDDVQAPTARLISPHGQLRQQHSLNGWHAFDSQWSMGAELVYGRQSGDGKVDTVDIVTGPGFDGASWWGVNSVLTYQPRPDLAFSLRGEHFRDHDGFVLFPTSTARGDFNAMTVGFRWDVSKNVSLRPELRYDWFEPLEHDRIYGNGRDRTQMTGLVEALVYF
ncbi:porin [Pseudomonas sp. B21-040]|uniref:porin n=1 Tax=Pseudomonas sp. B21-040 TaxID=2895486 RepID=UPI00215F7D7C|nr:porin [Pseudomonas sp. B21-040]UVL43216.1 porin [Pseudomonas sp. B21-040]